MNQIMSLLHPVRAVVIRSLWPGWRYLNTRELRPISTRYGFDRGVPIDRYYIEGFLRDNQKHIHGTCLEIDNNDYTVRFGGTRVRESDVLDIIPNKNATILGDLRDLSGVVEDNTYDTIILTHTLNIIDDYQACLRECRRILRPGGTLLMTMPTVSPTTSDGNHETNLWRFTVPGARYTLGKIFGESHVIVEGLGNRQATESFWMGYAQEDLDPKILIPNDERCPLVVGILATKNKII